MGDVDLLVPPERAAEAWSLLQGAGWKWSSDLFPADWYRTHHHLPPLYDATAAGVGLELHRAALPPGHPFRLEPQTLWVGAKRIQVSGQAVWVPNSLDRLLHLCVHFAWSHRMRGGVWRAFRDVAVISGGHGRRDRAPVDWPAFVDLARDSRAATCCYWTLRLARGLAGAPVPDDVLQALRPTVPTFVMNRLERHYVFDLFPTERHCPSEQLRRRLWELGIGPRRSEHGATRPWTIPWADSADGHSASPTWPNRVLAKAKRARAAIGYLGRITALPA